MKIIYNAIIGNKAKNEIMRELDLFLPSKQLGEYVTQEIVFQDNIFEGNENLLVETIIYFLNKKGHDITFLAIVSIDDIKNQSHKIYFKEGVSTISTGSKWGMFKSILEKAKYKVEVNQFNQVTNVSYK